MGIRKFYIADYVWLAQWLHKRGIKPWDERRLPKVGYVVFDDDDLIVMGFLRLVEGGYAMIDGLCSNPDVKAKTRNAAIDHIVTALMSKARDLNLRGIMSFSHDENTIERALRMGFEKRPEEVLIVSKLTEYED